MLCTKSALPGRSETPQYCKSACGAVQKPVEILATFAVRAVIGLFINQMQGFIESGALLKRLVFEMQFGPVFRPFCRDFVAEHRIHRLFCAGASILGKSRHLNKYIRKLYKTD